ncbi:hypothetical protein OROHE_016445 [Orobanche hederae]
MEHKKDPKKKALGNICLGMLQPVDEAKAERSLLNLCDLHRRNIWSDDRIANAICRGCFHPSSRIMVTAMSFLLDFEKIKDDDDDDDGDDDGDDSDSQAEQATPQPQIVLNKEAMQKASRKGTTSSMKKKKAKLQQQQQSVGSHRMLLCPTGILREAIFSPAVK